VLIYWRLQYSYWFALITDDEKKLRRMDSWELARLIHEETVHPNSPEKRIVAEHFLQVRIAKIQSRATYMSAFVGFVGGLAGAALLILFQSNT
jgi:hypothetical protein